MHLNSRHEGTHRNRNVQQNKCPASPNQLTHTSNALPLAELHLQKPSTMCDTQHLLNSFLKQADVPEVGLSAISMQHLPVSLRIQQNTTSSGKRDLSQTRHEP
jgi:hypothetical protein